MPRRIPCAGPGCTAKVDAAHKSGLCRPCLDASLRRPPVERPPSRWPTRVALVPQITGADGYQYRPVTVVREPIWRELE